MPIILYSGNVLHIAWRVLFRISAGTPPILTEALPGVPQSNAVVLPLLGHSHMLLSPSHIINHPFIPRYEIDVQHRILFSSEVNLGYCTAIGEQADKYISKKTQKKKNTKENSIGRRHK
jgi:hypothetical protein